MRMEILFEGEHENHDLGNGSYRIYPHTSSVTYLSDGTHHVLFDTGSLAFQDDLKYGLEELGVHPDDITHVCLTHFHTDHTTNAVLFKNAVVHASMSYLDHKTGEAFIMTDRSKLKFPCGIEAVPTPGHTPDHVVYFFEVDGVRYCCAGDAVREDNIKAGAPEYYDDERRRQFLESARMIFENCDVIIPGHFKVIDGNLKDELYKRLLSEI